MVPDQHLKSAHKTSTHKQHTTGFQSWLKSLGPGLITAALVFGPSKMTITSKMGALYGSDLLWIIAVAIFFMTIFTSMAARIGTASQTSLLQLINRKWGKYVAFAVGAGVFLVCTSFQAGNAIGVGIALAELAKTTPTPWIIVFTLSGISLLFFKSFYKLLEKIMIGLIVLMLLSFIITLVLAAPDTKTITNGFTFKMPGGSLPLVIAFMASCVSIVGALYQSYLVQEKNRLQHAAGVQKNDSVTGILILGVMSAIVLLCAATVLHPAGVSLQTATDMSRALEPLFGEYAAVIFLIGLFGAAFSSLIGNATVGGSLLGDAMGFGSKFNNKKVRLLIALVMITGACIAIGFGGLPLELIVFAQSITIFIVPFIGVAMFIIANDEKIMGSLKNSRPVQVFGGLGLIMIIGLAVLNFKALFL
jgi:Mn2+/Fe2+ NRAMP family transporter